MAHEHYNLLAHVIFTVKDAKSLLPEEQLPLTHRYLAGLVTNTDYRCRAIAVGGTPDHVHMLLSYTPSTALGELVRNIKTLSCQFICRTMPSLQAFEWHEGHACISVSPRDMEEVAGHISSQDRYHIVHTTGDELARILRRAGIDPI